MVKPEISVIIPVYNTEKYLNQCLDSVCAQDYKNLEIICVDDASTDSSPEILEQYRKKDGRITVITLEENRGQSFARNIGIERATGEWLTFVDSDDWIGVECYRKFLEALPSIPSNVPVYMFNGVSFTKNEDTPNDLKLKTFFDTDNFGGKNNQTVTFDDCINPFEGNLSVYNKIFKTDFIRKNNLKFKEGLNFQDSLFWTEAFILAKEVYMTDEVFYYYRQQENSVQHSITHKVFDLIVITNLIKEKLKEFKLYEVSKYALLQYKFRQYSWFFFVSAKSDMAVGRKFFESAKNDLINEIKEGFDINLIRQLKDFGLFFDFLKLSDSDFFEEYIWSADKTYPQKHLDYFCIQLVGECNLKCRGCDHFSPLAVGEYLSLNEFEKDFKRLAELTETKVKRIGLMGGEPLLHPELIKFFPVSRKYFPDSDIQLVTNGILLSSQKEDFWLSVKKYAITIMLTKYPININEERILTLVRKYNVRFSYYNNPKEEKTSYKIPLDPEGKQDAGINFKNCFHSNKLCLLKDGKIYPCTVAPNVYRFNNTFNYNLPVDDGIDIFKLSTEKELLENLTKPLKMCRYCDIRNREYNLKWARSEKDISEWT